jgi:hypothetical protein
MSRKKKTTALGDALPSRLQELLDFANSFEDAWFDGYQAAPVLAGQTRVRPRECTDALSALRAAMRSQIIALHERRPVQLPTVPAYSIEMLNELSGTEATELAALLRAFDEVIKAVASETAIRIDRCERCGQFFANRLTGGRPGIYCMTECRHDDRPQRYQRNQERHVENQRELRRLKKAVGLK